MNQVPSSDFKASELNINNYEHNLIFNLSSNKRYINQLNDDAAKNTHNNDSTKKVKTIHALKSNDMNANEIPSEMLLSSEATIRSSTLTSDNSAAARGFNHNHTYTNGAETSTASDTSDAPIHPYSYKNKMQRILEKMKMKDEKSASGNGSGASSQAESRDDIYLRLNHIDLTFEEIVNSNSEEFNELLKRPEYTQPQLTFLRDMRRRAKNKIAAQVCRKRKLDSIESLTEDVNQLKEIKSDLMEDQLNIHKELSEMANKFNDLYSDILNSSDVFSQADGTILQYINNLKLQLSTNEEDLYSADSVISQLTVSEEEQSSQDIGDYDDDDSQDDITYHSSDRK